ncbi:hypothetical protein D3C78_705480 [compost metagenome]
MRRVVNLGHQLVDVIDMHNDRLHRVLGLFGKLVAFAHFFQRVANQLLDFFHRIGTAGGQRTHFLSDNGKTFAVLTRTRGFHRGVQRQNIGLKRDRFDHARDVFDTFRCVANIIHGGDRVSDGFTAVMHGA